MVVRWYDDEGYFGYSLSIYFAVEQRRVGHVLAQFRFSFFSFIFYPWGRVERLCPLPTSTHH